MTDSITANPLWQLTKLFTEAPIWVWPLFIFIIIIGLRTTKTREIHIGFYYALPLLGLTTISNIFAMPNTLIAAICFFASYLIAAAAAFKLQKQWILNIKQSRVRVAGEWLTFTSLMLIFGLNFIRSILEATNPNIYNSMIFIALFSSIAGLVAGSFLGRSLRILYTSRTNQGDRSIALPNKA